MKTISYVIIILILFEFSLNSTNNKQSNLKQILQKPQQTSDIWLDANRLSGVFRNNGIWHFDVIRNTQGTFWPAGTRNSPIFASGQWIGAKVNGEIKVAAIQHSATEFQPGEIDSPGVALNPKDPKYRWYELRSDGGGDWNNWPIEQGAPLDKNGEPLLLGDQTIFSVWNDLADHTEFGTNKLSVEVRQTAFAFDNNNALGDMQFIKWQLVNKSGEDWDSTYFTLWQDPDLGDASDDLVGCDTVLGLGFCYNAGNDDRTYGIAPPATGMDFMQGPIVDEPGSIVTLPDGTVLQDKKMLQLTCFLYYDGDDSYRGNPSDGEDVWNFMRGFWRNGAPITYGNRGGDPPSAAHPPTTYMFSGDPESQSGWLDYAADDRRFIMTTGPFPMPAWSAYDLSSDLNGNGFPDFGEPGVQEIVAAVMVARGTSNLNSVTVLKEVDQLADIAYRQNFKFVTTPEPPAVQVSELPNEIILSWDERSEYNDDGTLFDAEDPLLSFYIGDTIYINNQPVIIDDSTFNFFGYTVYQYSSIEGDNPVVYDHWDIGEGKDARPYTETRHIKITENRNSEVAAYASPLINGKEYYFAIVAEAFNEFGNPNLISNEPEILTIIPRVTPGTVCFGQTGDTIEVEHLQYDSNLALSDGNAEVYIVDPSKLTGHDYKVIFKNDTIYHTVWDLIDESTGDTLLTNQTNQRGDDAYTIVDGLLIKVTGPAGGINTVTQVDPMDWSAILDDNVVLSLGHQFSSTDPRYFVSAQGAIDNESTLERLDWRNNMSPNDYVIEFVANPETEGQICLSGWADAVDPTTSTWFVRGWVESDTAGGVKTYHDTGGRLPFKVWRKTAEGVLSQVTVGILDGGEEWYWDTNMPTPFTDASGFDRLYICDYPYDEAELLADGGDNVLNNIYWGSLWDSGHSLGRVIFSMFTYIDGPFQGYIAAKPPAPGTVIYFNTYNINTPNDYFTFTTPVGAVTTNSGLKQAMKKIKVVPNPYYGFHSGELSAENRWVQFTYLPPQSTIRIFTLAGHLCRKLEKNDPSTPFLKWDMRNEHKLPVGSGVYVYHVDAPGIGEKIGKIIVYSPDYK